MKKYLNIFHQEGHKECYIVDESNTDNTRKIETGQAVRLLNKNDGHILEATMQFDYERDEFYLEFCDHRDYKVQGTTVL